MVWYYRHQEWSGQQIIHGWYVDRSADRLIFQYTVRAARGG